MERNRRIAKAYTRVPVLNISGSDDGFDGYKIGLNGFDNHMRDGLTKTVKSHIGKGVRLKMDDKGNIIIKRMSNCNVFIRGWDRESNSLSKEIIELSGVLEFESSLKLFDMNKFQSNVVKELRSAYPNRKKLESQCICAIAFVKDSPALLDLSCWVLLINIVALDLLKSKLPNSLAIQRPLPLPSHRPVPKYVSIFDDETEVTQRRNSDEDPYSSSSLNSREMARDKMFFGKNWRRIKQPENSVSGSSSSGSTEPKPKPPQLPPPPSQVKLNHNNKSKVRAVLLNSNDKKLASLPVTAKYTQHSFRPTHLSHLNHMRSYEIA